MKFRFEDFLKNIIPGMILTVSIGLFLIDQPFQLGQSEDSLRYYLKEFSELILLLFLVLSYLIGYINDGLSSWLEYYCIYYFVGTPALRLLRGKGERISLVTNSEILSYLKTTKSLKEEDIKLTDGRSFFSRGFSVSKNRAIVLFKHANTLKDSNPLSGIGEKIKDYYYAYIFARNLFFSSLFSSLLLIIKFHDSLSWKVLITLILINVFLGIRRRDRSYYYTRNILLACKY